MDSTVFYCVVPYDLEHLDYQGASFYWDGANRRWFVRFSRGGDGSGGEFNMCRSTVTQARKAIAERVSTMPEGGTVLVVQFDVDHEKSDTPGEVPCFTDIHMLPFDDGENFNRNRTRRNDWCPSSADLDWPVFDRTKRFDRLDKYENEGG